jgi:lipoprotein NlpD
MKQALPCIVLACLMALLAGCAADRAAPVVERSAGSKVVPPKPAAMIAPVHQIEPSHNGLHTVEKGDTLYAIAFANNLDVRDLASWNKLTSPDLIRIGLALRLTAPNAAAPGRGVEIQPLETELRPQAKALPVVPLLREPQGTVLPYSDANWAKVNAAPTSTPVSAVSAPPKVEPALPPASPAAALPAASGDWLWPANGTLQGRFGSSGGKGIDIVGERNTPIVAVAPGRVVYSGSGLRGYGKLIIIKHPGEFLSAYAHNQSMLVKEGDTVSAGQKIALMGDSDAERVKLHFEIRQYGRPLDPLKYLPSPP